MNHSSYIAPCVMVLVLGGCNDSSSTSNNNNSSNNNEVSHESLDGIWAGIGEDINLNSYEILANVSNKNITRFVVNGIETGESALTTQLGSNLFGYTSNFGVIGRMVTDPSNSYAAFVNEYWDFAVVQKGASPPFGIANVQDLNGSWSGRVYGLFGGGYYSYIVKSQCGSGTCVVTAMSAATDDSNGVIGDFTGTQATYTVSHRENLVFDYDIGLGSSATGFGAIILSKDRNFMGFYGCRYGQSRINECEYGALVKD